MKEKKDRGEIAGFIRNVNMRICGNNPYEVIASHNVDYLVMLDYTGRQQAHEIVVGKPRKSRTRNLFIKHYGSIDYFFITIKGESLCQTRYQI